MEFVRIFDDENSLLSVKINGQKDGQSWNEFRKIFDEWTDTEYLDDFFSSYESDLKRPFWEGISIEQAIIETRSEALKFREQLKKLSTKTKAERISLFTRLFRPLNYNQSDFSYLNKKKVYGVRKKTWLRIYAVKVGDDMYIITGGAIKLTDNMEERPHTLAQLKKLDSCRQYLKELGVIDEEGIIELLEL
jgi:hypothetical protein